jgi:hypothetical protein
MQPFRATLIDDQAQAIAEVEGSIESPEETQGSRRGRFEVQEDPSFMQGVLDQKTFHLQLDDGSQLTIKVDSASTASRSGYSLVEFSCTAG